MHNSREFACWDVFAPCCQCSIILNTLSCLQAQAHSDFFFLPPQTQTSWLRLKLKRRSKINRKQTELSCTLAFAHTRNPLRASGCWSKETQLSDESLPRWKQQISTLTRFLISNTKQFLKIRTAALGLFFSKLYPSTCFISGPVTTGLHADLKYLDWQNAVFYLNMRSWFPSRPYSVCPNLGLGGGEIRKKVGQKTKRSAPAPCVTSRLGYFLTASRLMNSPKINPQMEALESSLQWSHG